MKSVRTEWAKAESDAEKLEWAKKWGDLLVETWDNPIYVSGHTDGRNSILDMMDSIMEGEYPDTILPSQVEAFHDALSTLSSHFKVLSYVLKGTPEMIERFDIDSLKSLVAEQIGKHLGPYIDMESEVVNGEREYRFNLVMLE